jgi:hypothetical protein
MKFEITSAPRQTEPAQPARSAQPLASHTAKPEASSSVSEIVQLGQVAKGTDYLAATLPSLIAVSFVVVGWLVIEKFARRREHRNDIRELVKNFDAYLEDIVQTALTFYSLSGATPEAKTLGASLKFKISNLKIMVETLSLAGINIDASEQIIKLRRSTTGGEFESLARQPVAPTSPQLVQIAADAAELAGVVRVAFYRSFLRG